MSYPIATNEINRYGGKFPVVFNYTTNMYLKHAHASAKSRFNIPIITPDRFVYENENTWFKSDDDLLTTRITKELNDLPYIKLKDTYEVKASEFIAISGNNLNLRVPRADVSHRIRKWWAIPKAQVVDGMVINTPDYAVVTRNGYDVLCENFVVGKRYDEGISDTFFVMMHSSGEEFVGGMSIVNSIPMPFVPTRVKYTTHKTSYDYWIHSEALSTTHETWYKNKILLNYTKHQVVSGTPPLHINKGLDSSVLNYATYMADPNRTGSLQTTRDRELVERENNQIRPPFGPVVMMEGMGGIDSETDFSDKLIFRYTFPKEYNVRGIRFLDTYHAYTHRRYAVKEGMEFDEFTVKLVEHMDSEIEFITGPTERIRTHEVEVTTNGGWLNSGSDEWGNKPVATGATINGQLKGVKLVFANRAFSNRGNDRWIGYMLIFKNLNAVKVGCRVKRYPEHSFVSDGGTTNLKYSEIPADMTTILKSPDEFGIFIKDYSEAAASYPYRQADNKHRWSVLYHPRTFLLEFYHKE